MVVVRCPCLHAHMLALCSTWRDRKIWYLTCGCYCLSARGLTCRCSRKLSSAPADSWLSRDSQSNFVVSPFSLPLSPLPYPIVASAFAFSQAPSFYACRTPLYRPTCWKTGGTSKSSPDDAGKKILELHINTQGRPTKSRHSSTPERAARSLRLHPLVRRDYPSPKF